MLRLFGISVLFEDLCLLFVLDLGDGAHFDAWRELCALGMDDGLASERLGAYWSDSGAFSCYGWIDNFHGPL